MYSEFQGPVYLTYQLGRAWLWRRAPLDGSKWAGELVNTLPSRIAGGDASLDERFCNRTLGGKLACTGELTAIEFMDLSHEMEQRFGLKFVRFSTGEIPTRATLAA